jgi:hypothetical protein
MEKQRRGRKSVLGADPGQIMVSLSKDDYNQFKSHCNAHGKSLAEGVRELIKDYLQTLAV